MKSSFFSTVLLTLGIFICISAQGQTKGKAKVKAASFELNKSLVGKWVAGTLDKGLFSLVLGEGGTGTFTASCYTKSGENDFCHCRYSSKISLQWKVKQDSLILTFATTTTNEGGAGVSPGADPASEKFCVGISCDMAKLATFSVTANLKGNFLRSTYILAGNTLDYAGQEYRKE